MGCGPGARTVVIQLGTLTFCGCFFSVFQGRNCYLKVKRILGDVENALLNVCLLITLCKMYSFSVCLLQSSWVIRLVSKAVIFDEERGKMAVLNSVENTIPETLSGQYSYSTSVLVKLGCLVWLQYFIQCLIFVR